MKRDAGKILHAPYIIRASGRILALVHLRDMALTIILWALYIYLLHDFFIFLGDVYHWLHDGVGTANAYPKLRIFQMLQNYGISLGALASTFIFWALYNRFRFAGKKRRKATDPVTVENLGEMYNLDPKDLKIWQNARALSVELDQSGNIIRVDKATA